MQFQQKIFGKGSSEIQTMHLAMRCFFHSDSLCHIFLKMYDYKANRKWENFDFEDEPHYIAMSKEINAHLINIKYFQLPTIHIRHDVDDKLREKITNILKERQGKITQDENQASHIIYPEIEPLPSEYARPLFKRGTHVMMH